MNKKLFTFLYVIISSVANILTTVIFIAVCLLVSSGILKVFHVTDPKYYSTAFMGSFTLGLVFGFVFYTKVASRIVEKFSMEEKFENNWFGLGKKKSGAKNQESEPEKKKTVLPSSVLPTDEEIEAQKKWGDE